MYSENLKIICESEEQSKIFDCSTWDKERFLQNDERILFFCNILQLILKSYAISISGLQLICLWKNVGGCKCELEKIV